MADTATKAAPAAVTKPERPDEETFKKNLAQAEKELKAEEERLVSGAYRHDNPGNYIEMVLRHAPSRVRCSRPLVGCRDNSGRSCGRSCGRPFRDSVHGCDAGCAIPSPNRSRTARTT
ncbi:unnamed protein product [Cercospora beticola]|nr:unnamed protein product [Cercospora beticola]